MRITMVKKRLVSGEPCRKCAQTEELLRSRGLWDRIDEVVWAVEGDPESPGVSLATAHGVKDAPFFIVHHGDDVAVYRSALKMIRDQLSGPVRAAAPAAPTAGTIDELAKSYADRDPLDILRWGLERFGPALGIAFSGAEDVVLIDLAARTGLDYSVFCLDTGRLHPETYAFIERVKNHYHIDVRIMSPDSAALESFVRDKGLFSFLEDGHKECCAIRKVAPLTRVLSGLGAWATGQRWDQSPETRAALSVIQRDPAFVGKDGEPLVKLNPLAAWSSRRVWQYIHERGVPFNALHERGFVSIGCAPCTRAVLPGQHEREGRWWWERADRKECGLHAPDE